MEYDVDLSEATITELPYINGAYVQELPIQQVLTQLSKIYIADILSLQQCSHYNLLLQQGLTDKQKEHASRYKHLLSKQQYEAGKLLQRIVLSHELDILPSELVFSKNQYGKPILCNKMQNSGLFDFNLSHSGNLVVLAVTHQGYVGVDIEQIHHSSSFDAIARLAFTQGEMLSYFKAPLPNRKELFIRCWALKEAYLKALGKGLSLSLKTVEFYLQQPSAKAFVHRSIIKEEKSYKNCFFSQMKLDNFILSSTSLGLI